MNVDSVLDSAVQVLREGGSAMAAELIRDCLSREFQETLNRLEVLLSLDKRFVCAAGGKWKLNPAHEPETDVPALFEQALALRERALEALLAEQQAVAEQLEAVRRRLEGVNSQLDRLGYAAAVAREPEAGKERVGSLDDYLRGASPATANLLRDLHHAILALPGVQVRFNNGHLAYLTRQRFAVIVPRRQKLTVYLQTRSSLDDPRNSTRVVSGGRERVFDVDNRKGVEYALSLISQAHRLVSGK